MQFSLPLTARSSSIRERFTHGVEEGDRVVKLDDTNLSDFKLQEKSAP